MASINHYPAHTPEQVYTCEATAVVTGRTEGLPNQDQTTEEVSAESSSLRDGNGLHGVKSIE